MPLIELRPAERPTVRPRYRWSEGSCQDLNLVCLQLDGRLCAPWLYAQNILLAEILA